MILLVQWLVSAVHSSAAENWVEHKLVVRLLENYNPQVSPFGTAQNFFFWFFGLLWKFWTNLWAWKDFNLTDEHESHYTPEEYSTCFDGACNDETGCYAFDYSRTYQAKFIFLQSWTAYSDRPFILDRSVVRWIGPPAVRDRWPSIKKHLWWVVKMTTGI